MLDANFKLDDLLKLELHKFADEVGEIVDCAQKEEKMEQGLVKLKVIVSAFTAYWTELYFMLDVYCLQCVSSVPLNDCDKLFDRLTLPCNQNTAQKQLKTQLGTHLLHAFLCHC